MTKEDAMSNSDPTRVTGPLTDAQLAAMEFEPESAEEAFRRGYQDGFLAGADDMDDLVRLDGMKAEDAFALCEDHYWDALAVWRGTNKDELVWPPALLTPLIDGGATERNREDEGSA